VGSAAPLHALQQQAAPATITDRSQSRGFWMMGRVQFGRVLNEQRQGRLGGFDPGLLPMWSYQGFIRDLLFMQEAIRSFEIFHGMLLGRQRGTRLACRLGCHAHGSPGASRITHLYLSKGLLGPQVRTQQRRHVHILFPFWFGGIFPAYPEMWVKVSSEGEESPRRDFDES